MADREHARQNFLDEVKAVIDEIMQASDSDDENDDINDKIAQFQHASIMETNKETTNESHVVAVDGLGRGNQAEFQDLFEHSNNNQTQQQQQQSEDVVVTQPGSSATTPSDGERPERRKADSSSVVSSTQTKRHKTAYRSPHYERHKKTQDWEPSKELIAALDKLMLPRAARSKHDTTLVAYAQHYLWQFEVGFLWVGKKLSEGLWRDFYYKPVWDGNYWVGRLFRAPNHGSLSVETKITSLDYYSQPLVMMFCASRKMDSDVMHGYLKDIWSYICAFPCARGISQHNSPNAAGPIGPHKFPSWALEKALNKDFKLPDWASRYTDPTSFTLYIQDVNLVKVEFLPAELSLASNPVRYDPEDVQKFSDRSLSGSCNVARNTC